MPAEKPNAFGAHLRAEWLGYTILAAILVSQGGQYFRDPGRAAVQEQTVHDNKREIAQHKTVPAHYGARQEIALIKQEQRYIREQMLRVLEAMKTNADLGIKTNRLLQDIASQKGLPPK